MKKSLLPLLVLTGLIFFNAKSQDTIPNNGFEQWTSPFDPMYWQSTNDLLPPGTINCYQTSNSVQGDYSIQLKTIDMSGMPVPGVITLGTIDINSSYGGIPFTGKPVALKGFMMHNSSGDEILIGIEFFKNGTQIGGGLLTTSDSIPDFTEFVIPLDFTSNENPDTLNITILTDPYAVGSSVNIDALEFEFETTGTNWSEKIRQEMKCFPNPSTGMLNIDLPEYSDYTLKVLNVTGKVLLDEKYNSKEILLNLDFLNPGMYIIVVESNGQLYKEKVTIL